MTVRSFVTGRGVFFPFGIVLGLIFGGLHAAREEWGSAAFALVLLSLFGAFLAFSPSEWAVSQSGGGDERERAINDQAIQLAYFAVVTAVVGAVGGFTHMAAVTLLRRRS